MWSGRFSAEQTQTLHFWNHSKIHRSKAAQLALVVSAWSWYCEVTNKNGQQPQYENVIIPFFLNIAKHLLKKHIHHNHIILLYHVKIQHFCDLKACWGEWLPPCQMDMKINKQEKKYRLTSNTFRAVLLVEENMSLHKPEQYFPLCLFYHYYFTFFLEHSSASLMYYSNRSND